MCIKCLYSIFVNIQMGMRNTAAVITFLHTCTYFLKPYEYIERSLSVIEGFAALANIQMNKSRNEYRGEMAMTMSNVFFTKMHKCITNMVEFQNLFAQRGPG